MKKTFITIFSLLYLVSTIGFGSVQHFCHHAHSTTTPVASECCCIESMAESSLSDQLAANALSCHVEMEALHYDDTRLAKECCDIHHTYNQIDSSSLPLNLDISPAAEQSSAELVSYPQRPQAEDGYALTTCADPSSQLNFPLLI